MQYVMINRYVLEFLQVFRTFAQTFYLFTFRFLAFSHVWIIQQKAKTETKKPHFCRFCLKTSLFVANKTLIYSVLPLYRAICTPPHPFLALAGRVSSLPKIFYFFIFYFFVKYSDFSNSAFLPNFGIFENIISTFHFA